MSWTISKTHTFSASHQLSGLPEDHPCARLHGHNFVIDLILSSDHLDRVGFVIDYNELRPFFKWVDELFDHKHLNDVVPFNPTSENMARWLYRKAIDEFQLPVAEVRWSETAKTWATYAG